MPSPPPSKRDSTRRKQRLLRWGLATADVTSVIVGILVAWVLGHATGEQIVWIIPAIPIWILTAKVNRLYDQDNRKIGHSSLDEASALFATAAITVAVLRGLAELFGPHLPSRTLLIIGVVGVALGVASRTIVRGIYRRVAGPELALLVGSGQKAGLVAERLGTQAKGHVKIVGYLSPDEGDRASGPARLGIPHAGTPEQLAAVVEREGVSRVVLADDALIPAPIVDVCETEELALSVVPANHYHLGPGTEMSRVADIPMLNLHFGVAPRSTLVIKRAFDLSFSAFLFVVAAPALLLAAVLIKLDSPGPVFFRQVRIGKGGEPFTMLKLRTMVADAERRLDELVDLDALDEPAFKIPNDPRITRVGRFLRRSSLDEVPQLINVLKGDMSLVGPRPEEEAVVALYDERQRQRLAVRPGLTGPMQVAGRGSLNFEERLALERDYLENMSIPQDILIMLQTPRAVIKGDGAY